MFGRALKMSPKPKGFPVIPILTNNMTSFTFPENECAEWKLAWKV